MPSVLFAAGQKINFLERVGATGVTLTAGTIDPLFPLSNLYDGLPERVCRFSTLETIQRILVDLNQVTTGNLNTWSGGAPVGWTIGVNGGTGTVVETTTAGEFRSGSAAKLTAGTQGVFLYTDFVVRAGERRRFDLWLRGDGTNPTTAQLINLTTGRFLASGGGSWSDASADIATRTTGSYANTAASYTVEDFFTCGADVCTLRLKIVQATGGAGFVDDVFDWPAVDVLSLHGHRLQDRCNIVWEVSSDAITFPAGSRIQLLSFSPEQKPTLYMRRTEDRANERLHRITFDNDGVAPVAVREVGELLLSQLTTLTRNHNWGAEMGHLDEGLGVGRQRYVKRYWPSRTYGMSSQFVTDPEMRQARDELWLRGRGGAYNVLLIPDDSGTQPSVGSGNVVMLGRMDSSWKVRRSFTQHYTDNDLAFVELPFASSAL